MGACVRAQHGCYRCHTYCMWSCQRCLCYSPCYLERWSGCDEQIGMHSHHMHCCWDPKHYWGHSCGLSGHSPAALLRSLSRREVFELLWVAGHGPRLGSILLDDARIFRFAFLPSSEGLPALLLAALTSPSNELALLRTGKE